VPAVGRGRAWAVVGLLWLAFLLNYIDRQVVFSIYPSLRAELGFTNATLGLIGSVFLWVYSASSGLMGRIADVFSRDTLVVACLVLWSLAMLGTSTSGSVAVFLFWRAVMGLTEALYLPASVALIATLHAGRSRSTALAFHQTAHMIGIVIGGWGGGWTADRFGWRPGFALLAAVGIGYAFVLRAGLPRLPPDSKVQPFALDGFFSVWRSRCYQALAIAYAAFCLMLWMIYAWLPAHLYGRFHLSQAESGLAATLYLQISTAVGVVVWGFAADYLTRHVPSGRFVILGLGVLLCAPFACAVWQLGTLQGVRLASIGFGFFAAGLHSNLSSSVCDVVAPQHYGTAVGTLNLIGGAGGGLAVWLAGVYKTTVGIPVLMGAAAVISAIGAILMIAVVMTRFNRERHGAFPVSAQ
jgi:MFS family permease